MSALVRHFGDVEDAKQPCGCAMSAIRAALCCASSATPRTPNWTLPSASWKNCAVWSIKPLEPCSATSTWSDASSRDEYDCLLGAMVQSGLIEIEEAEFEKDGEVIRFRKARLTNAGREARPGSVLQMLISDGVVEEFAGAPPARTQKSKPARKPEPLKSSSSKAPLPNEPIQLTPQGEALAARIREWRASEAKRLRVPAYVVLHDRSLAALALARPRNPKELLGIDGIGPAKVERFGEELLRLCATK